MTKALYDELPYENTFKGKVLSCDKQSEELYKIVLDQTLFFPEQGGQTSDIGTLNGLLVEDVQIENEIIYHFVKGPLEVDSIVEGKIDYEHRFDFMQQHSGEHIFCGLAHNLYNAENVGFHLSANTVTLDLDVELNASDITKLEKEANKLIARNVKINCYYPSEDELNKTTYRSKKEIEGSVRLVEIEGVDICACCAPHVATTGQVGMIKVASFGKYKGGTRIYILCGLRALEDYNKKQELISLAYQQLNCQEDEISSKIGVIIDENKNLKYQLSQIKAKQLLEKIEKYPSELADVIVYTDDLDMKNMREGVNALVEKHDGLCAIFSGNDEDGYSFVIGSKTRDCKAIVAGLSELLGAKGGGSKQMAQGSVSCSRSQIEGVL